VWFHNGACETVVFALCGVWQARQISPADQPCVEKAGADPRIDPALAGVTYIKKPAARPMTSALPADHTGLLLFSLFISIPPVARIRGATDGFIADATTDDIDENQLRQTGLTY